MSWQRDMTEIIRVLIGDMEDPYKYSDDRIERLILVSAYQVIQDVDFSTNYVISISSAEITPSPIPCNSNSDIGFVNLVTLKAAMLMIQGEVRIAASSSIKIIDGPSQIETKGRYDAIKGLLDYLSDQYDRAKMDYTLGVACPVVAITTPTTNENVPPGLFGEGMDYYLDARSRNY